MKTDWAKVLEQAIRREPDEVPAGWETAAEIAKRIGYSPERTGDRLRAATAKGLIEMKKFRIATPRGLYPTPHYREVKQSESKRGK